MSSPRFTADELGAFFAGPDDTLWRLVSYAADPTATLERVFPPPTSSEAVLGHRHLVGGVVGSPLFDGFARLVLDGGVAEKPARCAYPGCPSSNDDVRPVGRVRVAPSGAAPELVFSCPDHVDWLKENGSYIAFDLGATA